METSEHDIQYFPLDYDALQKGDTIAPEKIEAFAGCKRGTDKFNLAMLAFRERVVRECRDRGKHFTVAVVKGMLRILTDEEAALYNAKTFRHGMKRAMRSYRRAAKVDISNLSDQQKLDHERNLIVFGKTLQGAASAKRAAIKAVAHERSVPGIPLQMEQAN